MKHLIAALLVATAAAPAAAESEPEPEAPMPRIVVVPVACLEFWSLPDDNADSVPAWNRSLSFAACVQDASTAVVTRADQLSELVGSMQEALGPSLEIYAVAIQRAPGPIKLRAAYQIGMAELALMTRARSAIALPAAPDADALAHHRRLHDALEPLLRDQAKLAWLSFSVVANATAEDPSLAPDVVTQSMVENARTLARLLGRSWRFEPIDPGPALADQNSSSAQSGSK